LNAKAEYRVLALTHKRRQRPEMHGPTWTSRVNVRPLQEWRGMDGWHMISAWCWPQALMNETSSLLRVRRPIQVASPMKFTRDGKRLQIWAENSFIICISRVKSTWINCEYIRSSTRTFEQKNDGHISRAVELTSVWTERFEYTFG
jgi:hypothetical protein